MVIIHFEGSQFEIGSVETLHDSEMTLGNLRNWVQNALLIPKEDVYILYNGKRLTESTPICDGVLRVVPRLPGGKGGFGSMLRAIGAQIEKTTNREACRDLSGRRLRDINEEKRLKNWISKKADRERDTVERKQKKLEKLRSEPKINFSDKKYDEERSKLTEYVHDAVEKGFQASSSGAGSSSSNKMPARRKAFMLEEEEFDDASSVSSSDGHSENDECQSSKRKINSESDSDEPSPAKKQHLNEPSNSSGSSSDSFDEPPSPDKRSTESTDASSSLEKKSDQPCGESSNQEKTEGSTR